MRRFNILPPFTDFISAVKLKMQLKKLNCTDLTALVTCWLSMRPEGSAISAIKFPIFYKRVKK
ncbi:hypothetical protein EBZ39_18305 [bacterium]|nr:hypothetical protein [bacterium]